MNTLTEDFLRLPVTERRGAGYRPARPARDGAPAAPGRLSRPVLLDAAQRTGLHRDLTGLYDLLTVLPDRLCGGDLTAYGHLLGLTSAQALAARRTAVPGTPRLARPDLYETTGGFRVLEMNVTAALGGTGISWQSRMYLADPAVRAFVAERGLSCVDTAALISRTLLDACAARGCPERPVVAVVDSPAGRAADRASSEYVALRFQETGFEALACDVAGMRRRDGALWAQGRRVDVVYRMFLIEEMRTPAEAEPFEELIAAQEAGEVLMLMPLATEACGGKAALGLLGEAARRGQLDPAEVALVDRILPWTAGLGRSKLMADGAEQDALAYCVAHREDLVLKPSWLHGGAGVVPGWLTAPDAWRSALESAVGGPWVVQRRAVPVTEPFWDPESAATEPWVVNWGIFLVGDAFGGISIRGERPGRAGVISQGNGAHLGCGFSG